jgi:hypothetical protein
VNTNIYQPHPVYNIESYAKELKSYRETTRPAKIREYWNYYKSNHWHDDELNTDRPTPYVNKIRTITNKIVTHTVGRPPNVVFLEDTIESLLGPYIEMLFEDSGGSLYLFFTILLTGSVSGDAFIKPVIDKDKVKLQVLDSMLVNPYYKQITGDSIIPDIITIDSVDLALTNNKSIVEEEAVRVRELWQGNKVKFFRNDEETKSGSSLLKTTPVVHIRNFHTGSELFGQSDIKHLIELNNLLNKTVRKFDDIIEYQSDPWFMGYGWSLEGAEVDARSDRTITGIPKEGRTELIELKTDLAAVQNAIDRFEEFLHEAGNITKDSIQGSQHISNTSATSLHYSLYPIVESVDRKRMFYKFGIEQAISMGLELMYIHARKNPNSKYSGILKAAKDIQKIYKKAKDTKVHGQDWNYVEIQFNNYFQKDQSLKINETILKVQNELISKKTAMKDIGVRNVEEELELIRQQGPTENNGIKSFTNEHRTGYEKSSSPKDKEQNDKEREIEKIGEDNAKKS